MGNWRFKKPEAPEIQGICVICHERPQKKKSSTKYKSICTRCDKRLYEKRVGPKLKIEQFKEPKPPRVLKTYKLYKKMFCEKCGFIPEHKCQLDVDHIDGDRNNGDPSNFQTLCANCHRLKTYKQLYK